jgi:nucleotide-binding universal stress UspA family protein
MVLLGIDAEPFLEAAMTFSTLMVHVELDHPNDARLHIAGELAEQFDAKLIGIAASNPQPAYYANGNLAQGLVAHERAEIMKKIAEAEGRFRMATQKRAREIEWRSALEAPTGYVAREGRAADLIITGANRDGVLLDPLRRLDPSDLVMIAGRPIFLVPPEAEFLKLQNVLVAWKDTREARRAVMDALPLLHRAKEVNVVEVVEGDASRSEAQHRVDDVTGWLKRHNIDAVARVMHARDEEDQIEKIWQNGADIVVAGAYGHSRFREWVLGGVTRNLITRSRHCALLAH